MPIIEPSIRPPSEARSFLLQVTTGCSSNSCTFCGAYKGKPFTVKHFDEIKQDILNYAKYNPNTRKVFIMDGDALVLSNNKLIPILKLINHAFPKLTRISSYANAHNITSRSKEELDELYEHKLKLIYMGLESGSQKVLDLCKKRATAKEMLLTIEKTKQAKIKSSIIVLLGLGGKEHSQEHVKETISVLNKMQPEFLSFLTLMVVPNTELSQETLNGRFTELNAQEFLQETHDILEGLDMEKTIFRCNHASNYFALEGRLPQNKNDLLTQLGFALNNKSALKPEFFRGL
jgi:radical SAM superfamily enzyme YgiQ (UPF0313 family)